MLSDRERRTLEWPRTLAKLQLLQNKSREIAKLTAEMQLILEMLTEKPDFETRFQEELERAEKQIAITHAFLKACNETYSKLPATA